MASEAVAVKANGGEGLWHELKHSFMPNQAVSKQTMGIIFFFWIASSLLAWIIAAPDIIPRPLEVLRALVNLYQNEGLAWELWKSFKTNVEVIVISMFLSLIISHASALPFFRPPAMGSSKSRFMGIAGLLVAFMSVFKGGHDLKIALMVFGMTGFNVANMGDVLGNIPKEVKDHARTLRMSEWEVVWEVHIRGTLAKTFDVIRANAAIGWMMLTMVEGLVRSGGGIGKMLLDENKHLNIDAAFALQLVVVIIAVCSDYIIGAFKNAVCPYDHLTLERR